MLLSAECYAGINFCTHLDSKHNIYKMINISSKNLFKSLKYNRRFLRFTTLKLKKIWGSKNASVVYDTRIDICITI